MELSSALIPGFYFKRPPFSLIKPTSDREPLLILALSFGLHRHWVIKALATFRKVVPFLNGLGGFM